MPWVAASESWWSLWMFGCGLLIGWAVAVALMRRGKGPIGPVERSKSLAGANRVGSSEDLAKSPTRESADLAQAERKIAEMARQVAERDEQLASSVQSAASLQAQLAACADCVAALEQQLESGPPVARPSEDALDRQLAAIARTGRLDYVDDLTMIKGVGPKLQKLLHDHGLTTFIQIAMLDEQGVAALNGRLAAFPGRVRRDNWVAQAAELHRRFHGDEAHTVRTDEGGLLDDQSRRLSDS